MVQKEQRGLGVKSAYLIHLLLQFVSRESRALFSQNRRRANWIFMFLFRALTLFEAFLDLNRCVCLETF